MYEPSVFTSSNETLASAAWDGILAGHGVVAIDEDYARQQKLPPTSFLPAGRAKGKLMYTLEAYHAMHCIVSDYPSWSLPPDTNMLLARPHYVIISSLISFGQLGAGTRNTTTIASMQFANT